MKESSLKAILNDLTLKEKIGQLIQLSGEFFGDAEVSTGPAAKLGIDPEMIAYVGSVLNVSGSQKTKEIQNRYLEISRHKIPLLFMGDVVYGYQTVLPIPLGQGATWNPELIKKGYQVISKEASKAGLHVTFAPMVDLVRDPRWGRCLESNGEDTYLNSVYAKAMVEGFQGNLGEGTLASCVKHFAAYGAVEGGRDYNTVDMSERRLRQDYLPSYQAAVDAGAELVMTSFNTVDGIPATANQWLLKDLLRQEWRFDGVIITDYAAIQELIAHGVAQDEKQASQLAIEASVDIDMKTACYANQLAPLVENGEISEKLIDEAVWRILKLKNKLGLFENPYRFADDKEEQFMHTKDNQEQALEVAHQSLVLLKNKNHILPLKPNKQKIALIGPYVDSKSIIGLWAIHGRDEDITSIKEAVEKRQLPQVSFANGCDFLEDYRTLGSFGELVSGGRINTPESIAHDLKEAINVANQSDVVVLALGEHTLQSGEAGSRANLTLPEIQLCLLEEIAKLGKPIVLVLFNGRPLVLTDIAPKVDAIIEAWFPGSEGGDAIVDVLTGVYNPSGRLSMSFPYHKGQIPVYYNYFNTGRPVKTSTHSDRFMSKYLDIPNDPLYPFGYGLSFSTFEYSNLRLSSSTMSSDKPITISIDVENTSDSKGMETVQLYIRDIVGSVVRPVKELKDFQKVVLEPKQKKTVAFTISEPQLRFFTKNMDFASEEGQFEVYVGHSSEENLKESFELIRS